MKGSPNPNILTILGVGDQAGHGSSVDGVADYLEAARPRQHPSRAIINLYALTVSAQETVDLVVVIPTYNPAQAAHEATNHRITETLPDLVRTAADSGFPVIISDDASACTSDPFLRQLTEIPGVMVIRHYRNEGIARGLNDGLREAEHQEARWLLTIDQDSRIGPDYIKRIHQLANQLASSGKIGALAPLNINDSSGTISYPVKTIGSLTVTEEVMQSGTLWNVPALAAVGGFDEKLAIDAVDSAACLRLREAGHVIALTPDVTIEHTLGNARQVQFFGRTVVVTGHSPKRRASIVRNRLRLAPAEFKQSPTHAFRTLRRVAVNEFLGWLGPSSK